ncbi:MAG: hypothetical protein GY820_42280, partial [Gammaproteobacteria bacterium]|nr:hypothetical protein [Gammaproteobacteria bacterium]
MKAVTLTPKAKVPTSTPAIGKLAPKKVVINDISPVLSPESQGDVASTSQAPTYPQNNTQTTVPSKTREFFGHNYNVRGRARSQAQGHRITEQSYIDPYCEEDPQGEFHPNRETGPPPGPRQEFPRYGHGRPDPAREYRKIPTVLCPRFGERYNTKDFNTFEWEFSQLCILCEVPADQKLTRFMLHLEGPIQNHAQCWLDSREGQIPEYRALIEELRRSFQCTIDVEEAESNLHGRKWNPYEMTI